MIAVATEERRNIVIDEFSCALSGQALANSTDPVGDRRRFCTGQMESYTNSTAGYSFWSEELTSRLQNRTMRDRRELVLHSSRRHVITLNLLLLPQRHCPGFRGVTLPIHEQLARYRIAVFRHIITDRGGLLPSYR